MECCREDGVISEVNKHDESQSDFVEGEQSEYFLKDCEDQSNKQLENEANRGFTDANSSDDECVDDTCDIFGDDWIGKPGVSTSEEEDLPTNISAAEQKKKRIRGKPMPSNITVVDGEPIRYKCTVCVKTFNSKGHIQYHAYCGQSDKPYKCNLCAKSFSKKTVLDYHVKTHTGERPFTCLMCDKSFLQLDKLKRHKRIHFGNNVECDVCHEKFRDSHSLNVHKKSHSETNLYLFKCCICSKSFKDKSTLNKHIKGVHSISKQFFCEHCGKGFDWKYNLVCHLRTHSGVRAYSCTECKRTFKNHNDCYKHRLTHTDEREYKCDVCGGTFKRRDNLVRHLRNIHPEKQPSKFIKVRTILKPSTSSVTTVNPEPQNSNKDALNKCSKSFCESKGEPSKVDGNASETTRVSNDSPQPRTDSNRVISGGNEISNELNKIGKHSKVIFSQSTRIFREPERNANDYGRISSESCRTPSEPNRIPNSSNIIFSESTRIPGESERIPSDFSKMPTESSRIPCDYGNISNPSNIAFIESNRHLAEFESSGNDTIRIVHNSNIVVNEVRRNPGDCGLLYDINRIPTETERVPSEDVRIPIISNIVFGDSTRFSSESSRRPNTVPSNQNVIFNETNRNPREPVRILNTANIVFGESSRFPVVPDAIPLHPSSNASDSNRISVIRSFNPSQSNNSAQQSSVIRHSGNTSNSQEQPLSPVSAVRDCVIKSTKP